MRGGRRTGRRRTVRGDSAVQDYPYSPPPRPSRYPTRHSTAAPIQFPTLSTPLRSPVRSIFTPCSRSAPLECENAVDDIKPVSDVVRSCSGPTPAGVDNLGVEGTSQEDQGAVDPQPSINQCLFSSEEVNMSFPNESPCCSRLIVNQEAKQIVYRRRENDVVSCVEEKPEKSNTKPVSDVVRSCSGPTPAGVDNLGVEGTSQEDQGAVDPQPSINQCLFSSEDANMSLPNESPCCSRLIVSKPIQDLCNQEAKQVIDRQRENDLVLRVEGKPEKSSTNFSNRNSRCLSAASTCDITAFAQRLQDDMEEDPDEVESTLDPAYVSVEDYNVKSESAPLLIDIFHRYGDITGGSCIKSPVTRSFLLQQVCDLYKRLKEAKFCSIPLRGLEEMRVEVEDLENFKINVEWLRKKLDEIIRAHVDFGSYLTVRKDQKTIAESLGRDEEELKAYEEQLSLIQQKISAKKEGILEKKAKDDQLERVALDIKARVRPLVKHGLLSKSTAL